MVSAYLVCIFHILHLMKKAIACALLHQHPRDHQDLLKPVLSLALCQETALRAGCSFPLPYTREASETLGASACSNSTSQTTYQLNAGYWNRGLQVHEPLLFLLMEKRRLRASCRHPPSPPRLGDTISSSYRELFTSASAGFRQTIPNRSGLFQ